MHGFANGVVLGLKVLFRLVRISAETIRDHAFRTLFILLGLMLLMGTAFYSMVEGWRALDALYFSVMTLSTVGYGDLVPVTDAGKLFTMFYVLSGVGILLSFVNVVISHATKARISIRADKSMENLRMPRLAIGIPKSRYRYRKRK